MAPPFDNASYEAALKKVADYFGAVPLGLRAQMYNVATLLMRDNVLLIPRYQRPYSWTEEHVGKLIQDLRGAWQRGGAFYFIGHFVLVRKSKNELMIADGQQRLATLTMLLSFFRERMPSSRVENYDALILAPGAPPRPRLKLRETDQPFFYEYAQSGGRFFELVKIETPGNDAQGAIIQAAACIREALDDLGENDLERFARFVCRCAVFNVMEADEPGAAITIFTSVNDSGLKLSAADMMKSALLERANMSEAEKDEAARTWESVEDQLGRDQFGELLQLTPMMFANEPIRAPGDLGSFVQTLSERAEINAFLTEWLPQHGQALFDIRNEVVGGPYGAEINRRIKCLKQLKEQAWLPIAVAFYARHGRDHEKTRRFFQGLDLIAFGGLLSAVRREEREKNWVRALKADGDEKKLFGQGGALVLTEKQRDELTKRLGAPFKRDHSAEADKRRLLLIRINACLPGGEVLSRETDDLTVEHILPVGGGPSWTHITEEERKEYAHLMGNWTLVARRQNQLCGNKGFDVKKPIFFNQAFPCWAVTRTLERVSDWGAFEIESRRADFQAALFRDWGLTAN
ncbi:MAG: DUF262 domain-containing protein [Hyphomonadaceae bacterium]